MASVADVQTSIWEDLDQLPDDALMLYVWSFTNANINPAGLYKVARRNLCAGRLPDDRLQAALDTLAQQRLLFYVDGAVWIRTHVKHYRSKTVQTAKSIATTLRRLTGHPLVDEFMKEYGAVKGFPHLTASLAQLQEDGVVATVETAKPLRVVDQAPKTKPVKHAGKVVPAPVLAVAEEILAELNQQASTKYSVYTAGGDPSENLKRILTAVLAHPEITPQIGAAMIRHQLANPYWQGNPDAGNVFGPRIVERNLEAARSTPDADEQRRRLLR